jgi:hypothetical protein
MAEKKSKPAEIKTKPTDVKVEDFLNAVPDERKRKDAFTLLEMMKKISGEKPVMWGGSIVGFGLKRYKSPSSGREVDWMKIGFSPRKAALTVYLMNADRHADALKSLGKHKTGGGCLYITKLEDVDLKVLTGIVKEAYKLNG